MIKKITGSLIATVVKRCDFKVYPHRRNSTEVLCGTLFECLSLDRALVDP